ncbi:hypothetical protein [Nocardioides panaciterrulae]|uniref:DUF3558 domain-containing protein n=1 Tax=Nocardioides panaciterrulae TaxID=661492 RepID=A0A7Y9JCZ2_9ACTN|nr:hypothetical protein [Nocardioides panaciterrulae]NYD42759.1 hypothetical protein [Nocardioides panaciterrulae]
MSASASDLRRLLPAVALAALAFVGVTSCDHGDDAGAPAPRATPTEVGTPLASLATDRLVVARAPFCDAVAPTAVEAALDSHVYDDASYGNGDRARLARGVTDVAHEYGCSWRTSDGVVAKAWVFAPPVTRAQGRRLAHAQLRPGCSAIKAGAGFGAPSVATSCGPRATGKGTELGYFGLFGDAWLGCTLGTTAATEPPDLVERADRWCAAVAQAASGTA